MKKRITEIELILPSLYLMLLNKGKIDTAKWNVRKKNKLNKPKGAQTCHNQKQD